MLKKDGVPSPEELQEVKPSFERLQEGPVVIVECMQEIPCDPCYYACPREAFRPFDDINQKPEIDYKKCNGCSICIAHCPGLAIFVLDYPYSENEGLLKIPYELKPLPEKEEEVTVLNRAGEEIGRGRVVHVLNTKKQDRTAIVSVAVPKDILMDARHIRLRRGTDEG